MRKIFLAVMVLLALVVAFPMLTKREKPLVTNPALGREVHIQFVRGKKNGQGEFVETNRSVKLSYDLKATLDAAKSTDWHCKCPCTDTLVIQGVKYFIFGDCISQQGNQLVERNDKYYLIDRWLKISEE